MKYVVSGKERVAVEKLFDGHENSCRSFWARFWGRVEVDEGFDVEGSLMGEVGFFLDYPEEV